MSSAMIEFKKTLAKISAVVITVVLVAILLSQISIGDIAKTLTSIDPIYLVIGFVLYLFTYFFRALRFHILLNNKVSIKNLFSIVCVHNMANNILPARTGEVSYVYLSKKLHGVPTGEGIATLMVARVFDFTTLSYFFFISTILIQDLPDMVSKIIWIIVGLLVFVLVLFLALFFYGEIFVDTIRRAANGINALRFPLVQYLLRKGDETVQSLKLMKSKKLFGCVFVASMMIWCFQYSMLYILANATNISLAFWYMILALTFISFITILPIPTIGGFGIIEGGWTLGFMAVGVPMNLAISSGFSVHILGYIYLLTMGVYGMLNKTIRKNILSS